MKKSIRGKAYNVNKQTIYIAPKSTNESRVQYSSEHARGNLLDLDACTCCLLVTYCAISMWRGGGNLRKHYYVYLSGAGICLGRGADLHMAQLMPLPPTVSFFSKSRLVLPFRYQLTQVKTEW